MKRIRSLKYGGIPLPEPRLGPGTPVSHAFLPSNALIMVSEHASAASPKVVVAEGQEVSEGQLLARSSSPEVAHVHAPVPGVIKRLVRLKSSYGFQTEGIIMGLNGSFTVSGKKPERYLWKSLNHNDILYIVQDKGVVDSQTGKALYPALHQRRETIIVNALQSDPYANLEAAILSARYDEVLDAMAIASRAASCSTLVLVLPSSTDTALVAKVHASAKSLDLALRIELFASRYPVAQPLQVARALKMDAKAYANALFLNPTTLVALHDAVCGNKAQIEQFVAVSGDAIKHAAILRARIGTPIGDLIEECGGFVGKPEVVVINNPFCDVEAIDLDTPVTKTTRGVLALTAKEARLAPAKACIRCGACMEVCPESLQPALMLKFLDKNRYSDAESIAISACTSCGACSYVCPSRLPLAVRFHEFLSRRRAV